jgi:hypothetical protein
MISETRANRDRTARAGKMIANILKKQSFISYLA